MKHVIKLFLLLSISSAFFSCSPQGGGHRGYLISQDVDEKNPSADVLHEG